MSDLNSRLAKFASKGYQSAGGGAVVPGRAAYQKTAYNATAIHATMLDNKVKQFCASAGYSGSELGGMMAFGRAADRVNRKHVGASMVQEWDKLVTQWVGRGFDFSDLWLLIGRLFGYSHPTTIVLTAPNGGETWDIGTPYNITWGSEGLTGDIKIELSRDNGGTWAVLAAAAPNTGTFGWTPDAPASAVCKVKVSSVVDPGITYQSDAVFEVAVPAPADSFKLEINIPGDGDSFTIPLENDGGTYTFTVDWGDGSPLSTITAWDDPDLTHVYAAAGVYEVTMLGVCTRLNFFLKPDNVKVRKILDAYEMGFTELCFRECFSLTSVSANMSKLTSLTTAANMFASCTSLTAIPAATFSGSVGISDFSYAFYNCGALLAIPAGLFDANVNAAFFDGTFNFCTSITTIPGALFANNTFAVSFVGTFNLCTSLLAIPPTLFATNTVVNSFENTFNSCTGINTDIPGDVFANCPVVDNFGRTFFNCGNMTGGGWQDIIDDAVLPPTNTAECFLGAVNLTNYAGIPAAWK